MMDEVEEEFVEAIETLMKVSHHAIGCPGDPTSSGDCACGLAGAASRLQGMVDKIKEHQAADAGMEF